MLRKFLAGKKKVEEKTSKEERVLSGKDRLIELLIHDLTGPLAIASTSTASLINRMDHYGALNDKQRRLAERTLRNIRKTQVLLQEMVEVFQSEEGLFKCEFFRIEEIVKGALMDVLEGADPQLTERLHGEKAFEEWKKVVRPQGISIEIDGKYRHSPFCHDPKKVRQVLRNLISNAWKYRSEKMHVMVRGDQDLILSVINDGVVIPPEAQEEVFKRFVRLNDRARPDVPGLGLGLTGVKALVDAMGGDVSLASNEESGTCFTVRIPAIESNNQG